VLKRNLSYSYLLGVVVVSLVQACAFPLSFLATPTPTLTPTLTPTSTPSPSPTFTPLPTFTPTPTLTPTPEFIEPAGCQEPPSDYTRIEIRGMSLNQRTHSMLQHAAELYGGPIDITGPALTQGSYTGRVVASFGTHSGGGAVDLSVKSRVDGSVLDEEIEPLLRALRIAGFAAWLREPDELGIGSVIHIHAIAIGDEELSPEAADQLTGEYGYFRGYSGLPPEYGGPSLDRYGGPVLCRWMLALGYEDLREKP
jgi:hypothetical protein